MRPVSALEWISMGAVSFSIDPTAVSTLDALLHFKVFVETGTFRGDSLTTVAHLFSRSYSIEVDPVLYEQARNRFAGRPEIDIRLGSSPEVLSDLRAEGVLLEAVLFWLDAHWCDSGSSDATGQCPLLEELAVIGPLDDRSVIAIDDARLFLAPPPSLEIAQQWPPFDEVLTALRSCANRHRITVFNDVIWAIPVAAARDFDAYAKRNSVDWLAVAEKARTYDSVLAQVHEKDAEILSLTAVLTERKQVIERLSKDLLHHTPTVESLLGRIDELEKAAEERLAQVHEKDAEILSLTAVLTEREQVIERLSKDLLHHTPTVESLLSRIAELEKAAEERLSILKSVHSEAEQRLQEFATTTRTLESRIAGLQAEIEKRQSALESVHAEAERGRDEMIRAIRQLESRNAELEQLLETYRSGPLSSEA